MPSITFHYKARNRMYSKFLIFVNAAASVIFFVIGLLLMAFVVWRLDNLSEWKAVSLCTYSLAMFFLAFRGNLSGLSVFGLKAELKEKIHEADAIMKDLRKLTILFMKPTITTVASLGRWGGGFSHREKWEIKNRAVELMQSIGIPAGEIDDALLELHRYNLYDLLAKAKKPLVDAVSEKHLKASSALQARFKNKVGANEHEEHNAMIADMRQYEPYIQKYKDELKGYDLVFNSHEELIKSIKECAVLSEKERDKLLKENQAMSDLKYYCEKKDFANPGTLSRSLNK